MIKLRNILLVSLIISLTSCRFCVHDDLSGCPGGVYVGYYQSNVCSADTTAIGDVSGLHLLAFDQDQRLVGSLYEPVKSIDRNYKSYMPLPEGDYTLMAWMGLGDDAYDVSTLKIGETTMSDLLVSIRHQDDKVSSIIGRRLYYGSRQRIHRPAAGTHLPTDVYTDIDMREITYHMTVEVELHESIIDKISPEDIVVEVTSANGEMTVDGKIKPKTPILSYPPMYNVTKTVAIANITTLDLQLGHNNTLRILNKKTGDEIWSGDLIGSILLKNPNLSLDCKHDFTMRFLIKDKCLDCGTYFCFAIYVDGWQIHSYETDLGQ